ncbi:MAG: AAA family ATPase [Fervidobacterium sp.]|nr:AAA family ATPase [Fervidobacterium sp.]
MHTATQVQRTKAVREAISLAKVVLTSNSPIGEITGETGTGKTMACYAIIEELGGVRVCAWEGITRTQLLNEVLRSLWLDPAHSAQKALTDLVKYGRSARERILLIIDEANKLSWHNLELLRYLADEGGFALILVGTELYSKQFINEKTKPFLLQLGRRIGAKRHKMYNLSEAELAAYVIKPRFNGAAENAELVKRFWEASRKGNWGEAVELAEECRRLLEVNSISTLTLEVLDLAIAWAANRHFIHNGNGRVA